MSKINITLAKSTIGANKKQRATVKALGFSKTYQVLEKEDTPQIRGMINKVQHLVKVEEI